MIYVVAGDGPRCGSAMMMQALAAGGLPVAFDPGCDEVFEGKLEEVNPKGLYELPLWEMYACGFPDPAKYDGCALKIFPPPWMPLTQIVLGEYRIVWMHRNSDERWASFFAAHSHKSMVYNSYEDPRQMQTYRDRKAAETLQIMHARKDIDAIEMDYREVLSDPIGSFRLLADSGWPIDPEEAAMIPTPKLWHMRAK